MCSLASVSFDADGNLSQTPMGREVTIHQIRMALPRSSEKVCADWIGGPEEKKQCERARRTPAKTLSHYKRAPWEGCVTSDRFQVRIPKPLTVSHSPSEMLSRRLLSVLSQESRWKSRLHRLKSILFLTVSLKKSKHLRS